jgi:RNA polymerase sigma-32 factor
MSTYALPALSNDIGLTRYLQEIARFPCLEPDEEYMLAKRLVEHQDIEAAHKMVTSHLRLVAKIAMGFRGYGLPVVELISEGNIGLMQAVKRFNPELGFRLSTYAIWWIKASIQEYILRSWSLVKIGTTAAQKKLFFNLRKIKKTLASVESKSLSNEDITTIATELNVSELDVVEMNSRMAGSDFSLNDTVGLEGDDELIDMLPETRDNQEVIMSQSQEMQRKKSLFALAMAKLNPRERFILTERRLKEEPATLEDLSQVYNISRERVRQIEARAIEKLQQEVQAESDAENQAA